MQVLKTVESRVGRLGGEKSQKNKNSESSNVVFGRVNRSHCNTFVMQISSEKNLQYFILFSNVFRNVYSGSLQHLSDQLCKQGQNLLENLDETTKTAGHYVLILLENKL